MSFLSCLYHVIVFVFVFVFVFAKTWNFAGICGPLSCIFLLMSSLQERGSYERLFWCIGLQKVYMFLMGFFYGFWWFALQLQVQIQISEPFDKVILAIIAVALTELCKLCQSLLEYFE